MPVNVTLLFSREHYVAAAEAYMRGIERRIAAGLNPDVRSVASVFVSRWDSAVAGKVPAELHDKLGIAVAKRTYKAYRDLLDSDRWPSASPTPAPGRSGSCGRAPAPRIRKASDMLYVKALAAPHTVNTMPEETLSRSPTTASSAPLLPRGRRRRRGGAGALRTRPAST